MEDKVLKILFALMILLYTAFAIGIWEYVIKPVINLIRQMI